MAWAQMRPRAWPETEAEDEAFPACAYAALELCQRHLASLKAQLVQARCNLCGIRLPPKAGRPRMHAADFHSALCCAAQRWKQMPVKLLDHAETLQNPCRRRGSDSGRAKRRRPAPRGARAAAY
jgi:hypothetical protein